MFGRPESGSTKFRCKCGQVFTWTDCPTKGEPVRFGGNFTSSERVCPGCGATAFVSVVTGDKDHKWAATVNVVRLSLGIE